MLKRYSKYAKETLLFAENNSCFLDLLPSPGLREYVSANEQERFCRSTYLSRNRGGCYRSGVKHTDMSWAAITKLDRCRLYIQHNLFCPGQDLQLWEMVWIKPELQRKKFSKEICFVHDEYEVSILLSSRVHVLPFEKVSQVSIIISRTRF